MEVVKDIINIGASDKNLKLFEGQYVLKNGMSYNSYVIMDERIAIVDTVDAHFVSQWLHNIETVLEDNLSKVKGHLKEKVTK